MVVVSSSEPTLYCSKPCAAAEAVASWPQPEALLAARRDRAVELCERQGKTQREAAEILGISTTTVGTHLRESGIPPGPHGYTPATDREARRDRVVDLYVRQGKTQQEVADELGVSRMVVRNDLRARGVPRASRWRYHVSPGDRETRRDRVVELYVRRQMTQQAVADELGVGHSVVQADLRARGVTCRPAGRRPVRKAVIEARRERDRETRRDLVVELYVHRQMTQQPVADELGVSRWVVRDDLRARGVPRAAGRAAAIEARRDRAVELCERQGKTQREAAEILGISTTTVGTHLRESGIPPGPHGYTPATDREARRDRVVDLYVRRRMSLQEVADELGVSHSTVRDDLRARGVTRRPAGAIPQTPDRMAAIREAHRANVERVKAERGLIGVDEVLKRLRRAGRPRARAAITDHIRAGLLAPELDLGFRGRLLFTKASVDEYIARLGESPDGRHRRLENIPDRLEWIEAFHGKDARIKESGRLNTALAAAAGKKVGRPSELDEEAVARVRDMAARGKSQRTIALTMNVSRKVVRNVLS